MLQSVVRIKVNLATFFVNKKSQFLASLLDTEQITDTNEYQGRILMGKDNKFFKFNWFFDSAYVITDRGIDAKCLKALASIYF